MAASGIARASKVSSLQRGNGAARNCAGSAIVVSNMLLAGIVTALHWLKPTDYPEKVFSSMAEAEAWLAPHLSVPSPSRLAVLPRTNPLPRAALVR